MAAVADDDDSYMVDIAARLSGLIVRLPALEGKDNKKERSAVNKEIFLLENDSKCMGIFSF